MYSAGEPSGHPIPRPPGGKNYVQIVQRPETHGIADLPGGTADRRRQQGVVELPVARWMSGSTASGNLRVTTTFGFEPMDVYCNESGRQSKRKGPLSSVVIKHLSARSTFS